METSTHEVTRLVFQLAIILAAAKMAGEVCERFLRMPAVLGEIGIGILIGPFALGSFGFPIVGALFEGLTSDSMGHGVSIPIPSSLWAIAQIGSIVLLFVAGLETDLKQFLRYARPATIVALGGVIFPFIFGSGLTVVFGYAESIIDKEALFIGAVLTATSIGITVRVLGDLRRLDSPEGVTVLGAAVLDDVIGILILTIVVGLGDDHGISIDHVGLVVVKTLGFWIILTGLGIMFSRQISVVLQWFKVSGAHVSLAIALALLAAGLAESFGLAMIIGAFSIGLAISGSEIARRLHEPLGAVSSMVVPVFFVVMGMLVDVSSLGGVWGFALVISLFAVVGKVGGSGLPALLLGFNRRGASRIGVGMLPRGEVALIMAGIGISSGVMNQDLYGVVIIMTIVTTALAPPFLTLLFRSEASGIRERGGFKLT